MTSTGSMHVMISKVIIGCNYFGAACWRVAPHIISTCCAVSTGGIFQYDCSTLRRKYRSFLICAFCEARQHAAMCVMWVRLNDRSNFNYMQLILDTQRHCAPAAGMYAYVICLQLCRSLKENNADKRR